jgi:hypothetical protein
MDVAPWFEAHQASVVRCSAATRLALDTDGRELPLRGGRVMLSATYAHDDAAPGVLELSSQDQVTGDIVETTLRLSRWPSGFEVREWIEGDVLVLCGTPSIVTLNASTLAFGSAVGLAHEEGELVGIPWCATPADNRLLLLATEQRVWVVDSTAAIRWVWSCQRSNVRRRILAAPRVADRVVHVPVWTGGGERTVELRLDDGIEIGMT